MKKFLDLKKSIVDSKNQPTLIQTYLDTIRSSCYKLATPLISSRHLLPANDNPNKNMQSKHYQIVHENNQKMSQKQTSVFPISSQSNNLIQDKDQHINTQNLFTPHKRIPAQFLATESPLQKIDKIFSTLSSSCKSNIQLSENAQQEIVQVILNNLCKLQRKKQYKDSVRLIRNIIIGLSNSNLGEANIFNHSQLKNVGYIVPREGENECEGQQSWEEEELKASQIKHKSQSQDYRVELAKNASIIRRKLHQNLESDMKNQKPNHEGNSIYIQEEQEKENSLGYQSQQTQRYESQNKSPYSNSMKSDQSYKWTQQSLYCIEEEQEQYQSSSAKQLSGCKIPEQTIQFKKIIYMLESNTNKKSRVQVDEESNISKQQAASKSLFLERIFSSDDGIIAKSNNLNLNRTYTQGNQKHLPQQQLKIDLQQTKLLTKNNLPENIQENSRTIKMLKQFSNRSTEQNPTSSPKIVKSEVKIKGIGGVSKPSLTTNGNGKSKQLADIVNMLKNKYNRNINVKIRDSK